jgi:hypothetical protein
MNSNYQGVTATVTGTSSAHSALALTYQKPHEVRVLLKPELELVFPFGIQK